MALAYYLTIIKGPPKQFRVSIGPFLDFKAAEKSGRMLQKIGAVEQVEIEEDKYPRDYRDDA